MNNIDKTKGKMTVQEAGRRGGKIGGEIVKKKYGPEFYHQIGTKGGHRIKDLIEEGKESEIYKQ